MAMKNPVEYRIVSGTLLNESFIAGIDEVGRGPLAGPVVSSCTFLKWQTPNLEKSLNIFKNLKKMGVDNSKLISAKKRMEILKHLKIDINALSSDRNYILIQEENFEFGFSLSEVSSEEIDTINILNASLNSMAQAFQVCALGEIFGQVLIDGNRAPHNLGRNSAAIPIVDGDSKSLMIALASIVAKEFRDHQMRILDILYPHYNFKKNMGYGTLEHKLAIEKYGVTPIHRRTFKGVKENIIQKEL